MSKIARNIMKKTLTGVVVLGLALQSVPTSAAVEGNVKDQKVVEAKESPKVEQAKAPVQKVENKVEDSALAKNKALKDKAGVEVKEKVKDEKKVEVTKAKEETKASNKEVINNSVTATTGSLTKNQAASNEDEVFNFPDANLKKAINRYLEKASDADITIRQLSEIKKLDISEREIVNLEGIQYCTSLISLDLHENKISDISLLKGLTNLTSLELGDNPISDISVVAGLTNLTGFGIALTNVTDISAIRGLKNLDSLSLAKINISDYSALDELTNLTFLNLNYDGISDLSIVKNFKNFKNLNYLWLEGNQISDLTPLRGLTKLKVLGLTKNKVSDISPLKELKELDILLLTENQVSDISPLKGLNKLRSLRLEENQVSDISVVEGLVGLRFLGLNGNRVVDVTPAKSIRRVDLRDQKISLDQVRTADGKVVVKNPIKGLVVNDKTVKYENGEGKYNEKTDEFSWDNIKEDNTLKINVTPDKIGDRVIVPEEEHGNKPFFMYSAVIEQPVKYGLQNENIDPSKGQAVPQGNDTKAIANNTSATTSNPVSKVEKGSTAKTGDVGMLGVLGAGVMSALGMNAARKKKKYKH